ncbi:hypothetical protein RDWZM_001563 [Blomia tropicalis]|uniref:Uncharacterized protein n=1 Tax=Blomia tropicalis TaxID=40697 RepID=A0A9Q0MDA6_BLOTA|nr:hypothetical protein RDWZM_001563 [Blomia tropicalis]
MKQYCITSVTSLTTILVIIINLYQLPTLINSAPTANQSTNNHITFNSSNGTTLKSPIIPISRTTSASSSSSMRKHRQMDNGLPFRQLLPVNLFSPCQIEDENWSETYFHDEQANEKYDHISEDELERFDPILSDDDDDIIIDNETEENENSGKVKVTLTKLSGKAKYGYDILLEMIRRSHVLQDLVTDMIRKHLIPECRHLELPTILEIPKKSLSRKQTTRKNGCVQHGAPISTLFSPRSANEKGPKRILNSFFNKRVHARRVADDFLMVSSNLRAFMCHFKRAFQLFEINVPTTEIVQQVLNHRINSDLTCARMAVLDCQLMQNSVRVFGDIEQFLRIYHSRFINHHRNHQTKVTNPPVK